MFSKYKDEIKECINDLKSIKTIYKQIPNMITLLRILGIIPINILYFLGNRLGALITSVIVLGTDMVDGKIARKYNTTSRVGAKLDAVCDKLMVLGLSIPLVMSKPLLLFNLGMELGISITNIMNEKNGNDPKSIMIGKIKTVLLSITLGVGYLSTIVNLPNFLFPLLVSTTGLMEGAALGKYISFYKEGKNNLEEELVSEDSLDNLMEIEETHEMEHVSDRDDIREKIAYLRSERELLLAGRVERIPLAKTYMKKMRNKNLRIKKI